MMKSAEFVQALERVCRDSAVEGCVETLVSPPGRRPGQDLLRNSQWFNNLSASDRDFVIHAMREAADATLFGVLCVIDGVRSIEPQGEKSEFRLTATRAGREMQISPNEIFLHDLLRSEP